MRSSAKIGAVVAVCLCITGGTWASSPPKPIMPRMPPIDLSKPFVAVSMPQAPLSFGEVPGPGAKNLQAKVTAHVVANRPYRLAASFQNVTRTTGRAAMPSKQLGMTINGKKVMGGTTRVQIASGGPTPPGGVDVPIVIEVGMDKSTLCPAGRYGGSLVLSISEES